MSRPLHIGKREAGDAPSLAQREGSGSLSQKHAEGTPRSSLERLAQEEEGGVRSKKHAEAAAFAQLAGIGSNFAAQARSFAVCSRAARHGGASHLLFGAI